MPDHRSSRGSGSGGFGGTQGTSRDKRSNPYARGGSSGFGGGARDSRGGGGARGAQPGLGIINAPGGRPRGPAGPAIQVGPKGTGKRSDVNPADPNLIWDGDHWARPNPMNPVHQTLLAQQGKPFAADVASQIDPAAAAQVGPPVPGAGVQPPGVTLPGVPPSGGGGGGGGGGAPPDDGGGDYEDYGDQGGYDDSGAYGDPGAYGYDDASYGDDGGYGYDPYAYDPPPSYPQPYAPPPSYPQPAYGYQQPYDPIAALHDAMHGGGGYGAPYDPVAALHDAMHRVSGVTLPGVTSKVELDPAKQLTVQLCVNGKCYSAKADLAPILNAIRDEIASWHTQMHTDADESADALEEATEGVVAMSGQMLVGKLLEQSSQDPLIGGWFDDVTSFIKDHKDDVVKGAAIAGGAAGTALLGPAGGAAAATLASAAATQLVPDSDAKKAAAKKAEADKKAAEALAKVPADLHPQVMAVAQQAAADTAKAYGVAATVDAAKAGNAAAKQALAQTASAAAAGDPNAAHTMTLASQVDAAAGGGQALGKKSNLVPVAAAAGLGGLALLALLA